MPTYVGVWTLSLLRNFEGQDPHEGFLFTPHNLIGWNYKGFEVAALSESEFQMIELFFLLCTSGALSGLVQTWYLASIYTTYKSIIKSINWYKCTWMRGYDQRLSSQSL